MNPHPAGGDPYFGAFAQTVNRSSSSSRPGFSSFNPVGANRLGRGHLEPIGQASPLMLDDRMDRFQNFSTVNNDFRNRFQYDNTNGYQLGNSQAWHQNASINTISGGVMGDGVRLRGGPGRARLPTEWYAEPGPVSHAPNMYPPASPYTTSGPFAGPAFMNRAGGMPNDFHGMHNALARQTTPQAAQSGSDLIPTAIVIKNIPFNIRKESLAQLMADLNLPAPYAFNYHFDSGVFRGLAFANFQNPDDTLQVIEALNGYEVAGRKLRVEYKKMLPEAERERIEREKREKRGQLEEQHQPMGLTHQSSVRSLNASQPSGQPKEVSPRDLDMNDKETLEFFTELTLFRNDPGREIIIFPASMTSTQRRTIHTLAHNMGLQHQSVGEGHNRQLQVYKNTALTSPNQTLTPAGVPLDLHRRGLSRAATIDFAETRNVPGPLGDSLGRPTRGPHLTLPDSPEGGQPNQMSLRGVKSFADLRSYTPSPSLSATGFAGSNNVAHFGEYTNGNGLQGQGSNMTTPTTPGTGVTSGGDANLLLPSIAGLSLGDSFHTSQQLRQRETPVPGAIGSQRPGVNGSRAAGAPDRQPLGPGSDFWCQPSMPSQPHRHRQQGSDASDSGSRGANGVGAARFQ